MGSLFLTASYIKNAIKSTSKRTIYLIEKTKKKIKIFIAASLPNNCSIITYTLLF